ncbi:hypothetical protein PPL_09106 [Heterostelium album PN500]|uniref:Uncharacterized protein n=1 Tax=Heterostelium pallidum (strain ATCC 26659 / Pp 5 / PN500) TaxID=670386 RepID=D3BKM4_HETP5|nr:hypothetical protein PPL_09106 [Heterostelium album PN500]EFA78454.1 hypothetical protein PPL_09106 [Heterostelium album PN500]|eukprot:XP_020430578.1 hypothetical protein PPL_09106 [Heterostelium album PN500]
MLQKQQYLSSSLLSSSPIIFSSSIPSLSTLCIDRLNEILLNQSCNSNSNSYSDNNEISSNNNNNNNSLRKLVDGYYQNENIDDSLLSSEQRNIRVKRYTDLFEVLDRSNAINLNTLYQYSVALPLDFITHLDFKSSHDLTNNVLHSISKITTIRSLSIANCKRIDQFGFQALKNVSGTNLDNECLISVKEMPRIEILNISGLKDISDIALVHLSACTTLTKLIAKSTPLTDDSLLFTSNYINNSHRRAGFVSLHTLILSDTLITDRGLPYLLDLPVISHIDLNNTKCTYIELSKLSQQFNNKINNNNNNNNSNKLKAKKNNNNNNNNNSIYQSYQLDIKRNVNGQSLREPDLVMENNQQWPIERIKDYLLSLNSSNTSPLDSSSNSILSLLNQSCESIESDSFNNSSCISSSVSLLNSSFEIDSSLYLPVMEESDTPKGLLGIKVFKDPFSNSPTKRHPGMIGNINISLSSPTQTHPSINYKQHQHQHQQQQQTVPSLFSTPKKNRINKKKINNNKNDNDIEDEDDCDDLLAPSTPVTPTKLMSTPMTPINYVYNLLKSPKRTTTLSSPIYSPKSNKKRQYHHHHQQHHYDLQASPMTTNRYPKSPSKHSPSRPKKLKDDKEVVRNLFNQ